MSDNETRFRALLEAIARPTSGYQCWHIAEARAALDAARQQADDDVDQDPLPFGDEAPR